MTPLGLSKVHDDSAYLRLWFKITAARHVNSFIEDSKKTRKYLCNSVEIHKIKCMNLQKKDICICHDENNGMRRFLAPVLYSVGCLM